MNQLTIGKYIAEKRRKQNFTQEQLAEKLGVSNKTISKWENGKCLPDYSIILKLCEELNITLSELMNGEDTAKDSVCVHDDVEILDLIHRIQVLEKEKNILYSLILVVFGIACGAISKTTGGTDVQDFVSGILMGISVGVILVGVYLIGKQVIKEN